MIFSRCRNLSLYFSFSSLLSAIISQQRCCICNWIKYWRIWFSV